MKKKNPIVKGRMYKVAGGGRLKGIRFKKGGGIDLMVQDGTRKKNPKKRAKKKNAKRQNAGQVGNIVEYRQEALRLAKEWRDKGYKTRVVKGLYGNWVVHISKKGLANRPAKNAKKRRAPRKK